MSFETAPIPPQPRQTPPPPPMPKPGAAPDLQTAKELLKAMTAPLTEEQTEAAKAYDARIKSERDAFLAAGAEKALGETEGIIASSPMPAELQNMPDLGPTQPARSAVGPGIEEMLAGHEGNVVTSADVPPALTVNPTLTEAARQALAEQQKKSGPEISV